MKCILGLCKVKEKIDLAPDNFVIDTDPGLTVIQEIIVTTNARAAFSVGISLEVTPPVDGAAADVTLLTTSATVNPRASTKIPVSMQVSADAVGDYVLKVCVEKQ